jgi:hypothetical protein
MRNLSLITGLIAATAIFACGAPAHAGAEQQRDKAAFKKAQSELDAHARPDQFQLAADRCERAFEQRQPEDSRIWCALASEKALARVDRNGNGPAAELDILMRAVWLSAVDGLHYQQDPWWGSPLAETVPLKDDLKRLSLLVLADFNRRDVSQMEWNFERLSRMIGAPRAKGETMGQLRRKTAATLEAYLRSGAPRKPVAEDVLWARAAMGLTLMVNDRRDDKAAEGRNVAAMLSGAGEAAAARYPNEAGLAPALFYVEGIARSFEGDTASANALFDRGAQICVRQIWQGAVLCDMLVAARKSD